MNGFQKFQKKSSLEIDYETLGTAPNVDFGIHFRPGRVNLAGSEGNDLRNFR